MLQPESQDKQSKSLLSLCLASALVSSHRVMNQQKKQPESNCLPNSKGRMLPPVKAGLAVPKCVSNTPSVSLGIWISKHKHTLWGLYELRFRIYVNYRSEFTLASVSCPLACFKYWWKMCFLTHVRLGPSNGRRLQVFFYNGCDVEVCQMDVPCRTEGWYYLRGTKP